MSGGVNMGRVVIQYSNNVAGTYAHLRGNLVKVSRPRVRAVPASAPAATLDDDEHRE
jgi:hypothetical protein